MIKVVPTSVMLELLPRVSILDKKKWMKFKKIHHYRKSDDEQMINFIWHEGHA
jgi:hypothetical protein